MFILKKTTLMFVSLVLMSALITACNTVAGAGQDIQAGGKAIQNVANDVK